MANILYITYNGLLDHIGKAQVLPYLKPAAAAGHNITLVSFEKSDKLSQREALATELTALGIDWRPQRFASGRWSLAKLRDIWRLREVTGKLCRQRKFDLIHCRSYVAAASGLRLKRRYGLPMMFDMRGLWVDQRREGGRWKASNPLYRLLYRYWKRKESAIVHAADEIVSLTHACADEVRSWPAYNGARITVCPCCVDTREFTPRDTATRSRIRADLGVDDGALILVYLGSVGSVYLLRESLQFFAALHAKNPDARFLFLGFHERSMLEKSAAAAGINLPPEAFLTRALPRKEVPDYLAAADAGLCFIIPGYSSLGVSATKLGEFLACGLRVFCNSGVGDVEALAQQTHGLTVLEDLTPQTIEQHVMNFAQSSDEDRLAIASSVKPLLDIEVALNNYDALYRHYGSESTNA